MIKTVKDKDAKYFYVKDLITGKKIHRVLIADDERGSYYSIMTDQTGREWRVEHFGKIKICDTRLEK